MEIWPETLPPSYQVLPAKIPEIDGLLCLLTDRIDRPLIEAGQGLKVISLMAVGYDNIHIPTATARKIPVGYTPGVLTDATADFAWALLMAAARKVVEGDRFTQAGGWQTWEPQLLLGPDVTGATLGIIGLGRIGQAMARRAKGFEMRILCSGRARQDPELERSLGVEFVPLEDLLQQSDFASLHTSLSDQTYHLLSDRQFQLMKSSAILINTARGPIVDPDALYRALVQGEIAGAAIDVTEPEPIPHDSPLLTWENLIITPHIGSASRPTREKMAMMAAANLIAGFLWRSLAPLCESSSL